MEKLLLIKEKGLNLKEKGLEKSLGMTAVSAGLGKTAERELVGVWVEGAHRRQG